MSTPSDPVTSASPGEDGEPVPSGNGEPEDVSRAFSPATNRPSDTRSLVEAAGASALSVALYVALLPLLGGFALPLAALPVIVVCVRRGLRYGLLCAFVGAAVAGLLLGPVRALVLGAFLLLVGVAQGVALNRGLSQAYAVLVGALGAALFLLFSGLLAYYLSGLNIVVEQMKETEAMLETAKQFYIKSGTDPDELKREFAVLERSLDVLPALIPALLGMVSLLFSGLNILLVGRILRVLGGSLPPLPRFADWQVPWWLAWGCLLGLAGYLFGETVLPSEEWVKPLSLNLLLFFGVIFGVQGLCIGYFFLERWRLPVALRWLILGTLFLFLSPILLWLGLLDVWFNYRKLQASEGS